MAIRPVDMQVLMPRATEVIKSDANLAIRADVKSQQTAELVQQQVEAAQQQVLRKDEAQKNKLDKDGRNGGGGAQKRKGKRHQTLGGLELINNADEKAPEINELGSRFDFNL